MCDLGMFFLASRCPVPCASACRAPRTVCAAAPWRLPIKVSLHMSGLQQGDASCCFDDAWACLT